MSDTLRLVADISESASTDNLSLTEEKEIEGNRKELKDNALAHSHTITAVIYSCSSFHYSPKASDISGDLTPFPFNV